VALFRPPHSSAWPWGALRHALLAGGLRREWSRWSWTFTGRAEATAPWGPPTCGPWPPPRGWIRSPTPAPPPPPPPQQQQQQQQPQEAEMRHRNQQQQQQSSQGSLPSWSTRAREEHAAAAARAAQVAAARSRGPAAMRHSLIAPRPPAANGEVGAQGLSARSSLQAQRLAGLTRARNGGGMAGPEPPAPRVARGAGNEL